MLRKLKRDPCFEPCIVEEDDELYQNGIFIFNITKMYRFIANNANNIHVESILIEHYRNQNSNLNESHLKNTDINKPGIIAEIAPGRYNLIDGNHRIEMAKRLGNKRFDVYRFNMESHLQFLTTINGYFAYVDYWNSKLE
jgi:hypothetical protein